MAKCTLGWNGKGIAQVINDLSNPRSFTLNQRAAGSIPARPTKYFTQLHSQLSWVTA